MPTANPFEYKFKDVEVSGQATRNILSAVSDGSSDSGKHFFFSAATTVNLPTAKAGLNYRFTLTADLTSTAALVINAAGSAKLAGLVLTAQGTAVGSVESEVTGDNQTKFTVGSSTNKVLAGSYVECVCDGTNWFLSGIIGGNNADINACAFGTQTGYLRITTLKLTSVSFFFL